jgi:putative flippase GtrA
MKLAYRYLRFNLIGLLGVAVQLLTLTLLNRAFPHHYLLTTAAAIELTLLHNFAWHTRYTWPDRIASRLTQLLRFHLTNGLLSLAGNLVLMRLFVHTAHLPVIPANAFAILACSSANFLLANLWAFAAPASSRPPAAPEFRLHRHEPTQNLSSRPKRSAAERRASLWRKSPLMALTFALFVHAAAQSPLPSAPQPPKALKVADYPNDYVGIFCGMGATTTTTAAEPTLGCGAGIDFVPIPVFIEVGIMGPQINRSYLSGYLSLDTSIPLATHKVSWFPMAILGYSRLFETGHAFDYGLALGLPGKLPPNKHYDNLRIELRDYWVLTSPAQHNIMVRIGWISEVSD